MVKIEYGHHRNIGDIYFEGGWIGVLYIDTTPKANDIKYISDVETTNGIDITKSKIVQEEYTMRFIASENMVKVLQKLPLLSNVKITVDSFEENKVYNLKFKVTGWIGGGSYAKCEMNYVINTFVNKNATIVNYG
jgi:hypothetical protein